jgi:radical SAM family RiPP maturation amino acid epimerase
LEELRQDPDIQPVFMADRPPDYAPELALVKRFCERWRGDAHFRESLQADPQGTLEQAGFPFGAEELRPLYDSSATGPPSRWVRRVWALHQEKVAWRESLREQMQLTSPGLNAWRRRQIRRCAWQLASGNAEAIIHPPAAFELSRGCSVGCWFCGVSAPRLSDLWLATPSNRSLWKEVLEVVWEICGPATGHSFLYWATDPLDNPDYEQFCLDFHGVTGHFPQTTTALALKNVERTRALLKLSQHYGSPLDRFSVLTLRQLLQIHQQFTPQELLRVELVTQNQESLGARSAAGKALSRLNPDTAHATTIACVSGFLFQMPDRRVRWVSPCPSSSRWPDGYRTHAEAVFGDARELRTILQEWSNRPTRLGLQDIPRFREDLQVVPRPGGFRLQDSRRGVDFHSRGYAAMERLGELLQKGIYCVEELCLQLDHEPAETLLALQEMHLAALFEDLP